MLFDEFDDLGERYHNAARASIANSGAPAPAPAPAVMLTSHAYQSPCITPA